MAKCFRLSAADKQYIETIKRSGLLSGNEWDKLKGHTRMRTVKANIRMKLEDIQKGYCAYCGNEYGVTSDDQIEHIAPKANSLHPEFMFKEHNLVLSCQLCNGFLKKGVKNTISNKKNIYKNCEFSIVHPYFDNPDDHYDFFDSGDNNKVLIRFKSSKGKASVEMFELDEYKQSIARAKDVAYEIYKATPEDERLVSLASGYKRLL